MISVDNCKTLGKNCLKSRVLTHLGNIFVTVCSKFFECLCLHTRNVLYTECFFYNTRETECSRLCAAECGSLSVHFEKSCRECFGDGPKCLWHSGTSHILAVRKAQTKDLSTQILDQTLKDHPFTLLKMVHSERLLPVHNLRQKPFMVGFIIVLYIHFLLTSNFWLFTLCGYI